MAEQLTFNLPVRPALGRGDFFVSPANAIAVAQIEAWQDWPNGKLMLVGPEASGKTHLAHVWAALTGGRVVDARELNEDAVTTLAATPLAVEDVDRISGRDAQERALFHLHNLILAEGHPLLLTGTGAPSRWATALPDLRSRLEGTPLTQLDPPDDALLTAVLLKQFADRQIDIDLGVIQFLAPRIDRDFAMLARVVDQLDREALALKKRITVPLCRRVLQTLDGADE